MLTRVIFLTSLTILPLCAYSQKEDNIWYFGTNAGIDFNSGSPAPITNGALTGLDCSSTICDSNGSLLFYTNGQIVWDKNHNIMSNGTGLLGNLNGGQSCLIVPQPYSSYYYIFTCDQFAGINGFNFHIVDMSLNAGSGMVISKNNLLFFPSTERIAATYNSIDTSFWVVSHTWNSNQFYSYKLDKTGLNTSPIVSSIGTIHAGGTSGNYNSIGQLTISKSGTKLACGIYSMNAVELFDFDKQTGQISNPILINGIPNTFGTSFSPDEKILYATSWFTKNIYQMNISSGNQNTIQQSVQIVGIVDGPGLNGYYAGYMELAPNGIIYIASFADNYIAQISQPNNIGTSCFVVDNAIYLNGKTCNAGLNRSVDYSYTEITVIQNYSQPNDLIYKVHCDYTSGTIYLLFDKPLIADLSMVVSDYSGKLIDNINVTKGLSKAEFHIKNPSIYFIQGVMNTNIVLKEKIVLIQ